MAKSFITSAENVENRDNVIKNWALGPDKASVDPKANGPYWRSMAQAWSISEAEARRQMCGNCEYFKNSPEKLEYIEVVPEDEYDADGGGRGYCEKFEFVCHNLRVCQAWEEREDEGEED